MLFIMPRKRRWLGWPDAAENAGKQFIAIVCAYISLFAGLIFHFFNSFSREPPSIRLAEASETTKAAQLFRII